jgi:hypothetical protein
LSSWERPGRADGPGAFLKNTFIKIGTPKLFVTPQPGRDDPYNPDPQRPGRISARPDISMSGLPGTKGRNTPPRHSPGPPSLHKKTGGTPEQKKTPTRHLQRTPAKLLTRAPVEVSQIFTRRSSDPLTTRLPFGERATDTTKLECPFNE